MDGLELGQDQVGRTVKVEQFEDKENVQVNYWTNTLIEPGFEPATFQSQVSFLNH